MSSITIMFIGLIFVAGWFLGYLFIRQIVFNFKTAYPVLKSMKETDENLIVYGNAKKYTSVSVATCFFVLALFTAVVFVLYFKTNFFNLAFLIAYLAGLVVSYFTVFRQMEPDNKKTFESFCAAYYRFIPDDQLRTDMYNLKIPAMKLRCHDLGISTAWIPSLKN